MDRVMILLISIFGLWLFISFTKKLDKAQSGTMYGDLNTRKVSVHGSEAEIYSIINKLGINPSMVSAE